MVSFFRKAVSAMEGLVALLLSGGGISVAELSVFAAELSLLVDVSLLLLQQTVKQKEPAASTEIKNNCFMIIFWKGFKKSCQQLV